MTYLPGIGRFRTAMAVLLLTLSPTAALSQTPWSSAGPAGHSPMGVMGDHTHGAGEWMASVMYSRISMSGLRDGTSDVTTDEAWAYYRMVPLSMEMVMIMPHLMWAPSDRVTLMAMGMWMDHRMEVRMANDLMAGYDGMPGMPGMDFHEMMHEVSGWADTEVTALVSVYEGERRRSHLHLGVGIPTGSITASDDRMVAEHSRLGYPMQFGSGSWEARPGATFLLQTDRVAWGVQAVGVLRLNENDEGWRRGPEATGNVWAMLRGNAWASPGARLELRRWGNVSGSDPSLDAAITPENDPDLQGGTRLAGMIALNLQVPTGFLRGHRLNLEVGGPLLESLNGPQMSRDWTVNVGWEYAF